MRPSARFPALLLAAATLAACSRTTPEPRVNPELAAGAARAPLTPPQQIPESFNLAPTSPLTARQQRWVDSTLASLSLRERVGQMVQIWTLGDYTSTTDPSYVEVRQWVERDGVGGVTMSLGTPIEVAAKINALQRVAKVPLHFASDLEPSLSRLEGAVFSHYLLETGGATVFPTAMAIAATGRDEDVYEVAKAIGREARATGIHINFAPTVDVNNNPANPVINTRSFGEDPARVARLSALFVRGSQEVGVLATAKHFPGHGDTDVDSHVGLPVVTADWRRMQQIELVPFRAAIEAGAGLVMSAHIALPALEGDSTTPATLAPRIMTGLLRDTLRFRGLTITDAMTMDGVGKGYGVEEASVLAVKAGADILLRPTDIPKAIAAVVSAVERGTITRARIDSSARRVLELKARTGIAFQPRVDLDALREVVGNAGHRALAEDIAQRAVTLLRERPGVLPVASRRTLLVQYMPETELKAGRVLQAELRRGTGELRAIRISPTSVIPAADSLRALMSGVERVIVAMHVRRIEGEGRSAVPARVAQFLAGLASADSSRGDANTAFVAFGNPYLLRQVPGAGTYLTTFSVGDASERAAARALLGRAAIGGTTPVSLPGFFRRGEGIRKPAAR